MPSHVFGVGCESDGRNGFEVVGLACLLNVDVIR